MKEKSWIIDEGSVQKTWLKIIIPLMSASFLINSKRISKASINKYANIESPLFCFD